MFSLQVFGTQRYVQFILDINNDTNYSNIKLPITSQYKQIFYNIDISHDILID